MIKIIGSFFVIVSTTLIGKSFCNYSNEKLKFLEDFKDFVFFAKNEIEYKKLHPSLIIKNFYCNSKLKIFFQRCSDMLKNEKNFQSIWKQIFQNCPYDDSQIILNFGKNLGSYDVENQIETCNLVINNITPHIDKIKNQIKDKEKISTILGICSGAIISILML